MLKAFSFVKIFQVSNWESNEFIPVLYNSNIQEVYNEIDEKTYNEIISYTFENPATQSPIMDSELFGMDALRHYKNGLRKEAVVSIQTSIESFFSSLYILLLMAEGEKYEAAVDKLENLAFRNLVEHHFRSRIGGNWDVKDEATEGGKWWKYTYMMRNKVVHEGLLPAFVEANDAIKYGVEFKEYVIQLVLNHASNTYDNVKQLLRELYLNSNETFVGKLFRNDISYDLIKNEGKLGELTKEIIKNLQDG